MMMMIAMIMRTARTTPTAIPTTEPPVFDSPVVSPGSDDEEGVVDDVRVVDAGVGIGPVALGTVVDLVVLLVPVVVVGVVEGPVTF